jgi:hypothetical protein
MRKTLGISAIVLLAGITLAGAQSQGQQGPTDQNKKDKNQPGTLPPAVNNLTKPAEPKGRNSGPPYGDCYLKCINTGNAADYCRDNASSYCK